MLHFTQNKQRFKLPVICGVIHRAEKRIYVSWGNKQNQRKNLFLIKAKNDHVRSEASHYLKSLQRLEIFTFHEGKKQMENSRSAQHKVNE